MNLLRGLDGRTAGRAPPSGGAPLRPAGRGVGPAPAATVIARRPARGPLRVPPPEMPARPMRRCRRASWRSSRSAPRRCWCSALGRCRRGADRPHRPRHRLRAGGCRRDRARHASHPSLRSRHRPRRSQDRAMTARASVVDCHAHIIDPARFPFAGRAGLQAAAGRDRHARGLPARCSTRMAWRMRCWCSRAAMASTTPPCSTPWRVRPGRFKGIADGRVRRGRRREPCEAWPTGGVVGVRFNLVTYDRDALAGTRARRALLARLKALGWFAQVFADDEQWPEAAPAAAAQRREGPGRPFRGPRSRRGRSAPPGLPGGAARSGARAAPPSSFRRRSAPRGRRLCDLEPVCRGAARGLRHGRLRLGLGLAVPRHGDRRPDYRAAVEVLARWLPDAARSRRGAVATIPCALFRLSAGRRQ